MALGILGNWVWLRAWAWVLQLYLSLLNMFKHAFRNKPPQRPTKIDWNWNSPKVLKRRSPPPSAVRRNPRRRERKLITVASKWRAQKIVWPWDIRTGQFAVCETIFILIQFLISHTYWGPLLITQEVQLWERKILPTSWMDETDGSECLENSYWTICSILSPFCLDKF